MIVVKHLKSAVDDTNIVCVRLDIHEFPNLPVDVYTDNWLVSSPSANGILRPSSLFSFGGINGGTVQDFSDAACCARRSNLPAAASGPPPTISTWALC